MLPPKWLHLYLVTLGAAGIAGLSWRFGLAPWLVATISGAWLLVGAVGFLIGDEPTENAFVTLWRFIRPIVYPWHMERDPDRSFKRWLRETESGRFGYQKFRATANQYAPKDDQFPEKLPDID